MSIPREFNQFFRGQVSRRSLALVFLRILPSTVLVVFTALFLFTLLSRLGVYSAFGGAVVCSGSMEPIIRRWDIAIYVRSPPSAGDVVVYCLISSSCIVHRYVADCPHGVNCIITKGDANPAPDPFPVSLNWIKGVVVCIIPREIWLPIFLYAVVASLINVAKVKLVGFASAMVYATILVLILVVYGLTQPVVSSTRVELPVLHLSKLELNSETCTLLVSYVGSLQLTGAKVYIDEVELPALLSESSVLAKVPREVAQRLNNESSLNVSVYATLNHVGRLEGNYAVRAYPRHLEVKAVNGSLQFYNPNCFPVFVNVSLKYAYGVGDAWKNASIQEVVSEHGFATVEPPEGSKFVYADVSYRLGGEEKWSQITVRYG
ncbi:MAG: signal peptidase I [Desulfurococcaceae archaeon]